MYGSEPYSQSLCDSSPGNALGAKFDYTPRIYLPSWTAGLGNGIGSVVIVSSNRHGQTHEVCSIRSAVLRQSHRVRASPHRQSAKQAQSMLSNISNNWLEVAAVTLSVAET